MKLSFTTLGCPQWDMQTIISNAVQYGFDAVDFRGYLGNLDIFQMPEFKERVRETIDKFSTAGLEVSCFSSSIKLFTEDESHKRKNLEEVKEYADLCKRFGTNYIRVFGGKIGQCHRADAIRLASDHLYELIHAVSPYNVKLILETHDDWTDCESIKSLLSKVDPKAVGVLWDIHHPFRTIGEKPEKTWDVLGDWIEYTHWKDSKINQNSAAGFEYCLLGEGDIPLRDCLGILKSNGYQGYLTLEWEKKWHPELPEPEVAFPQFSGFMRDLIKQLG